MSRSSRMLRYVGYRMKITLQDARVLIGTFMAFDKHMNLVLGECEEFRRIKGKEGGGEKEEKEEKRVLGLVLLRGDSVVSLSVEGPPPPEPSERLAPGGPGVGKAAGRGMAVPMAGGAGGGMMPPPGRGMTMPPPGMPLGGAAMPGGMPGMMMPPPGMSMGGMPMPPGPPGMMMPPPGPPGMMGGPPGNPNPNPNMGMPMGRGPPPPR